jgi:capsular polysaccharide transport system permease protein
MSIALASGQRSLRRGLSVQLSVIGALMLRELHTRFGRENIGYLWLIGEPMLLAAAVAALHSGDKLGAFGTLEPVPFALIGYTLFIMFRSIVSRAESVIEANRPLFYHRQVTLFDMLAARAALEGAATTLALAVLLSLAWALDMAQAPARPLALALAIFYLWAFSFGLSMLVTALCFKSHAASRLIHPLLYLSLPLSGAFFVLDWIPLPYQGWLAWFPLVQIFEQARLGMFAGYETNHVQHGFILLCIGVLFFLGLAAVRAVRRHIDLS